jgi:hypothetical protein
VRQPEDAPAIAQETADFTFNFQIMNLGARHACSVRVRATTRNEAASFYQQNWSEIEKLARKNLANSSARRKLIRLDAK